MQATDVKKFLKDMDGFSTIPSMFGKIRSFVEKEDPSLKELEDLITYDQATAERVLREANSRHCGHSGQVRDIRQAIMLLGFKQIKDLVAGMGVLEVIPCQGSFNMNNLWFHSYEVGLISSVMADRITMISPEECLLAGLLHDIGRIIFYSIDHQKFYKIVTTDDMLEIETDLFGCTHAEAGAWWAEAAGLPSEIIASIRFHHCPSKTMEFRDSVSIISLAEALSRMFDPRIEDDGLWTGEHDALLLELGIDSNDLAVIGGNFFGSKKEAEKFFNA